MYTCWVELFYVGSVQTSLAHVANEAVQVFQVFQVNLEVREQMVHLAPVDPQVLTRCTVMLPSLDRRVQMGVSSLAMLLFLSNSTTWPELCVTGIS